MVDFCGGSLFVIAVLFLLLLLLNRQLEKYLEEPGSFRVKYKSLGNSKLHFILKLL